MAAGIIVKETAIDEAVKVSASVKEFNEIYTKQYFEDRYKGKKSLVIVAYIKNNAAGYIVGYDKFGDGSFYCWMAGVNPKFRGMGVLKALMSYFEKWCKKNRYNKIKIKTRNNRREMLSYLVKYGFYFTEVEKRENIEDNRVSLEKKI